MSVRDSVRGKLVQPYEQIDAPEAKGRMDSGAILIDVREPHEWQAGHAQHALHIPLAQLDQRQRELPAGRSFITVCRSGARSAHAASLLAAQGREVSNLRGGMRAWVAAGLPLVAKGGRQGAVI